MMLLKVAYNGYSYVQVGIYNYKLIKIEEMTKKAENTKTAQTPSLNVAGVSGSTLFNREGKLIVSKQLILEANESTLREIFTNFFPIDADRHHAIS